MTHPLRAVMTVLVHDEADIIGQNISHHLACGFDHVVAMDNASTDGTTEILEEYERAGVLTLLREPSEEYLQDIWMTRMALLARDRFSADWVFCNDADEFLEPVSGDIKADLDAAHSDALLVHRVNMLTAVEWLGLEPWPLNLRYRPESPMTHRPTPAFASEPLPAPLFYLKLPPKVLMHTAGLRFVERGAHKVQYDRKFQSASCSARIRHYPIRSVKEFAASVERISQALSRRDDLEPFTSWKYRRWAAMLDRKEGFDAVLADALPTAERLQRDLAEGSLVKDLARGLPDVRAAGLAGMLSADPH